ncbi:hypothetical protein J437_LFUL018827, partial [Ladona fulva]
MTFYYQNVRGLRSKISQLCVGITNLDCDVFVLTETNLSDDILDMELRLDNYSIYRKDRSVHTSAKKCGGGVLIAVNKRHKSSCLVSNTQEIEQQSPLDIYKTYCDSVEVLLSGCSDTSDVIICGDFNLPGVNWNGEVLTDNSLVRPSAQIVSDMFSYLQLRQRNFCYNSHCELLDLVFSSSEIEVQKAEDAIFSVEGYHPVLIFDLNFTKCMDDLSLNCEVLDLKNCDNDRVSYLLSEINWDSVFNGLDVEQKFGKFVEIVNGVISECTPVKRIGDSRFPRWYNTKLIRLLARKRKLHYQYKKFKSRYFYDEFCVIRSICRREARVCYDNFVERVQSSIPADMRLFWNYVNSLRGSNRLPETMFYKSSKGNVPHEIVNLFASYFSNNYNPCSPSHHEFFFTNDVQLPNISITLQDVRGRLRSLNSNKGPGSDGIPPSVL